MFRYYILLLLLFFVFFSCSTSELETGDILARVGYNKLSFKDLPDDLKTPPFNKKRIRFFVNKWVDEIVLFSTAKKEGFLNDNLLLKKRDLYFKKLIISSFLDTKTLYRGNIKKEDVLLYYNKNKLSFLRKKDGVFVRHFKTDDLIKAKKIKKILLKKNKEKNLDRFLEGSSYVLKGELEPKIDISLFEEKGSFVGPVQTENGFHVFDILSKHKKGSVVGLEEVHDEIYQRLIKKKSFSDASFLLDSLRGEMDVFINPNY